MKPTLVTKVVETEIGGGVKLVEKVEPILIIQEEIDDGEPINKSGKKFPFTTKNLTVEVVEQVTEVSIVVDKNPNDAFLDYYECFTAQDDPFTYIINTYRTCPEVRPSYVAIGRYIAMNNLNYLVAPSGSGFREVADFTTKNQAAANGMKVCYWAFKWDSWIGPFRGCWNSPFYGKGIDYVEYLFRRGRAWENCLATLEAESTFGLGGTCYYGILYGSYQNTLEGYCNLLDERGTPNNPNDPPVSNDPWEQACFWNMPGYPRYQEGFCRIVNTIKGWNL